jgi:hypothetical protein
MTEVVKTRKKKSMIRGIDGVPIEVSLSRTTAIKVFCTECMGDGENPKECTSPLCPLFLFRGKSMISRGKRKKHAETPSQQ